MSGQETSVQPDTRSEPDVPGQKSGWVRLAGYAVGVFMVIGVFTLGFLIVTRWNANSAVTTGADSNTTSQEGAPSNAVKEVFQRTPVSEDELVDQIGVRIVYVAVSGDGGLIDLRFQVVDPDKANAVHAEENPPTIVDESTGLVVNNLLMGHSHTGTFNTGQTYYLIFENPGNIVQTGNKVSVLLGNAEVDHIVVK